MRTQLLSFILLLIVSQTFSAPSKLELQFFGSSTCGECHQLKEALLDPLQSSYFTELSVQYYDTDKDSVLSILLQMRTAYNTPKDAPQMLFFPDTVLGGYEEILKNTASMVQTRIKNKAFTSKYDITKQSDTASLNQFLKNKAFDWGFLLGTLITGLTDGINPCAIATMIFLISFLATRKKSRREILIIGVCYTTTVFITYFSMGLGLKGILEHLKGYHIISDIIRWSAFALAVIVAFLSFKDAILFKKTGNTDSIQLQLPKAVKLRIHKIISGNLTGASLVIGSIITGFLVTLLEAICTGQMYLPYIVAMTQQENLKLTGYLYLAFYNFLFVFPLLVVMILAYYGMKWNDLAKKTQKNMVLLKVIVGVVMTGLALYLLFGSFI
jgi:hypothetical protein